LAAAYLLRFVSGDWPRCENGARALPLAGSSRISPHGSDHRGRRHIGGVSDRDSHHGKFERRRLSVYGIPRAADLFGRSFRVGAGWGLAMPSAIILLIFLSGGYHVQGLNVHGIELAKFAGLWLLASLLIGFSEEITYRGYFLYTLSDGVGFWTAALVNAIGFGALHYFLKPHEGWEDWVAVSLLTIFLVLALRRTGSLAFAIGMHAAFDFMFIYVYSGMNGGEFGVGRLLKAEFPGSTRITGGLPGPEASWFCFLVAVVGIAAFDFTYRQAKWPAAGEQAMSKVSPDFLVPARRSRARSAGAPPSP